MTLFICQYCNRQTTNAGANKSHENRCKNNPSPIDFSEKRKKFYSNRIPWNKGLSKETDNRIESHALTLQEKYKSGKLIAYRVSETERQNRSIRAKKTGLGGYRPHPNKGQYYKDTWFDSNWEVKVAKSLDKHNIVWERPKFGFIWTEMGNKYYPDFYLPDYDVYLDPKNEFLQKKDKIKIDQAQRLNNIKVIVLSENQLEWDVIAPIVQR